MLYIYFTATSDIRTECILRPHLAPHMGCAGTIFKPFLAPHTNSGICAGHEHELKTKLAFKDFEVNAKNTNFQIYAWSDLLVLNLHYVSLLTIFMTVLMFIKIENVSMQHIYCRLCKCISR